MGDQLKFRTELNVEKPPFFISLKDKIFLAGSCFSDVIGELLLKNKFNTLVNPFGNIYNPHSLFKLINKAVNKDYLEDYSFLENNNRFLNYYYHSEIYGNSKDELRARLEDLNLKVGAFVKASDIIILTLGTSYVYRLVENDQIVANCHKVPAQNFRKYLLSPKEIIDDFEKLQQSIFEVNPKVKFIFTVSPVRHLKDSIPLNNLSKSILRTGIHYICESFKDCFYFPSYELMMDDLRDYRFYKEDLIHPTAFAEQYIWKKFSEAFMNPETLAFINEWENISKSLNHKPFHPASVEHQKFLKDTHNKLLKLNKSVNLDEEIEFVKRQII
jgi:hypothetical protein